MNADPRGLTEVAVGLVLRAAAGPAGGTEVLMGQRPPGKPYAGWWEFPGGKLEAGESVADALARELKEELAIEVRSSEAWLVRTHSYPHARVRLHFRRIFDWQGEPRAMEQQAFAWQPLHRIGLTPLLPAALPLLEMLRWPESLTLHGFDGPHHLTGVRSRLASFASCKLVLDSLVDGRPAVSAPRVLIDLGRLDPTAAGFGEHCARLEGLFEAARRSGLMVYAERSWFERLGASLSGFWSRATREGMAVLEVCAPAGQFAATDHGEDLSVQALVLEQAPGNQTEASALACAVEAPLYWPDPVWRACGGHGTVQWV